MRQIKPYDQVVAGDVRTLSKWFDIPQYVLRMWQLEGFISRSVITPAEWETLNMIRSAVWDNRHALRAMLKNLPATERRRLIDTCTKTAIERIVYNDFLRFKLSGTGIMGDNRPVTYQRYEQYLSWRHPYTCHLLTRRIFESQRKAALSKISYARRTGTLEQLKNDLQQRKPLSPTLQNHFTNS